MAIPFAADKIKQPVLSWEHVVARPHRFGGTEFCLGTREISHLHGDYLADIPFPKKVRDEFVAEGAAVPHHILPETGWVSFYLRNEGDIERAITLFRRSYEIALKQKSKG